LQWKNNNKYVLDTMSNSVGKVHRMARKPWNTRGIISNIDVGRKWEKVNNTLQNCTIDLIDQKT
jgi:hypothetical protein